MGPDSVLFFAMGVQALLTLFLLGRLAIGRYRAAVSGAIDIEAARLDSSVWPDNLKQISNCVDNQFQTPILFFAAGLAALQLGVTDWIMAGLALAYAATRLVHAFIHTGGNSLRPRFQVFVLGYLALTAMWIYLIGWMVGRGIALA